MLSSRYRPSAAWAPLIPLMPRTGEFEAEATAFAPIAVAFLQTGRGWDSRLGIRWQKLLLEPVVLAFAEFPVWCRRSFQYRCFGFP